MSKKPNYCPECGKKTEETSKFCNNCGYKLIISETAEDKEGHTINAEKIIESDSPIEVPEELTLMPGEKILEKHMDFYVSNKRLIRHKQGVFNSKTKDYHYRHVKGMQEEVYTPLLGLGILGIFLTLFGFISIVESPLGFAILIVGIILIVVSFPFKKNDLLVMHMDGGNLRVPDIESDSGKKVADVLRNQLYKDRENQ